MEYYASGKLMLFGEYLVLRGAACLAIPLCFGQRLFVSETGLLDITWQSECNGNIWFNCRLSPDLQIIESNDTSVASKVALLLDCIRQQNKALFEKGLHFRIVADFDRNWGFGSSSTLISCLSQWSGIDAFYLLENSFGGSGYDVACATATGPIIYQMQEKQSSAVYLYPKVTSKLLFVYSGRKQNTFTQVDNFSKINLDASRLDEMDNILIAACRATQVEDFERAMIESENILSDILGLPAIKQNNFADYPFAIKSLGAWGGDFFMASYRREDEAKAYFTQKGYPLFFTYNQLIKK